MPLKPTQPRPWVRLLAKQLDYTLLAVVVAFPAAFLYALANPEFLDTDMPLPRWVLLLVVLPIPLIEGLCLGRFGSTPGKWLTRTRVVRADGQALGTGQAVRRSYRAYAAGIGFGIPLITLFTTLAQYRTLTTLGVTSYDDRENLVVLHEPMGLKRSMMAGLVQGLLLLGLLA